MYTTGLGWLLSWKVLLAPEGPAEPNMSAVDDGKGDPDPDPPKGNPGVDVEPKMGDLVVCQLELNTPEVMPLVELLEVLASGKETEELLLDPNSLEGVC